MKKVKKYNLITFEGIDGTGKTTIIKLTEEFLKNKNFKVFLTTETKNSESLFVKNIREILMFDKNISPKTELLLFESLRREHFEKIIEKKIAEGYVILCDRFIDSSMVYQGIQGVLKSDIEYLNNFSIDSKKPGITFLFDLDPKKAIERIYSRDEEKTKFDKLNIDFFTKARDKYLEIAKENEDRIKVIDASQNIESVFSDVKTELEKWLK